MKRHSNRRWAQMTIFAITAALIALGGVAVAQTMFPDVSAGDPHAPAIEWAAENGIVEGYSNGDFGPYDEILRGQAATMFMRYDDHRSRPVTYEVTLENLTAGQPLSPPIFVTGDGGYGLFAFGAFADEDLQLIAEMGDNSAATDTAGAAAGVTDVEALMAPLGPGEEVTVMIEAVPGDVLSVATMLVRTNDAFTGVDRIMLPANGGTFMRDLATYDAGTEENNELEDYVPGPPFGGTMRAPTDEPITMHPGLEGIGDVSVEMYGWEGPSARITVEMAE